MLNPSSLIINFAISYLPYILFTPLITLFSSILYCKT